MASKTASISFHSLIPLVLLLVSMLAQGACTCIADPPLPPRGVIACIPQHPIAPVAKPHASGVKLSYHSSGSNGVLGMGFSIAGLSAITRCPSNLAQDDAIREVRYDAADELCLDGKRLVAVEQSPGVVTYRTFNIRATHQVSRSTRRIFRRLFPGRRAPWCWTPMATG